MSFKREGDDYGSLNILKKRRVAELLVEAIPEEEAFLMKNGLFACLVCPYRPVFDTVNMLAVHRKGKKHLSNAEHEQQKKHELNNLWQKRQHEQFMTHGCVSQDRSLWQKTLQSDQQHSLLSAVPYDRRSKVKHKPHERRPILDLTAQASSSSVNRLSAAPEATTTQSLPGQRGSGRTTSFAPYSCEDSSVSSKPAPQTISEYKKLCHAQSAPPKPLRPYTRNHGPGTSFVAERVSPAQHGNSREPQSHVTVAASSPSPLGIYSSANLKSGDVTGKHKKVNSRLPVYGPTINEERQKRAEAYLHQRGGGWKKDSSGKWVKDEDAEFDSDEEPPALP